MDIVPAYFVHVYVLLYQTYLCISKALEKKQHREYNAAETSLKAMVIMDSGQLQQVQTAELFGTKQPCHNPPNVSYSQHFVLYVECGSLRLQIIYHCAMLDFDLI